MQAQKEIARDILIQGIKRTPKGRLISEPLLVVFVERYVDSCLKKKWLVTGPIMQFLSREQNFPRGEVLDLLATLAVRARSEAGVVILPPDQSYPVDAFTPPPQAADLDVELEVESEVDDRLELVADEDDWE